MAVLRFEPVKTAVVGLGRFGKLHAATLQGLAEAELVGLVARRQASLDAVAHEYPDVPGWIDLSQAIDESGAEAWVVACTTGEHVPVTRALLEAGKVVLLEKPIASNLTQARSLESLVRADSGNLMLGHILLFNSEFRQLRREVAERGPLSYLNCVRHRPDTIVAAFPDENPLHAAMVHDLYCVQALVNGAEPVSLSAQTHRTPGGVIDLTLAQLKWDNGLVASLAASYLTPEGMPPRGFDRMEVFGAGWSARIRSNPRPLELWDQRARWPLALEILVDSGGATGMLAEELRCFCRVVRGTQSVPSGATYPDALQVQQWMERLEVVAV